MDKKVKDFQDYVEKISPKTNLWLQMGKAFLMGGIICCIGQFFMDIYTMLGNDTDTASAYTSITLVLISALLTGFGQQERIAKHAGAGTLVPITGFANAVVSPALEFKTEGLVLGTGAKMFVIAGPVIVYGIAAAFVYGLIYWIIGLFQYDENVINKKSVKVTKKKAGTSCFLFT